MNQKTRKAYETFSDALHKRGKKIIKLRKTSEKQFLEDNHQLAIMIRSLQDLGIYLDVVK